MTKPNFASWVSPYIAVKDVDKTADFYQKAFQFKLRDAAKGEDGITCHAEMLYKDQLLMMGKEDGDCSFSRSPATSGVAAPISMYVYTDNVDEFYKHAIANGAQSVSEPTDMFWGDRMCNVKDIDGYTWGFATKI